MAYCRRPGIPSVKVRKVFDSNIKTNAYSFAACSEAARNLRMVAYNLQEDRYDFCNPSHPGCPNNSEWPCSNNIYGLGCDTDNLRQLYANCANGWCVNANGTLSTNGDGTPWCDIYCPIKNGKPCYDKLKCNKQT